MGDLFSSQTEIPWLNSYETSWNKITQNNNSESDAIIKGTIEVMYRNYVINKKR